MDPLDLVDLERFPLREPNSARWLQVVAQARLDITAIGAAEISDFLTPDGVAAMVADAEALAPRGHRSGGRGGVYLEQPGAQWPEGHPRLHRMDYGVSAVGYDVIPSASPLRALYESEELTRFIEAIIDRGPLYHYADPCGALNLAVMTEGDELQWHFDQTDFVVSLAIQSAERGGDFEVVPRIRSRADESYDAVSRVLRGEHQDVVTLAMTPGTLLIFEGRNSLHRVSPIRGVRRRHVGLLAYDTTATTVSSEELRRTRYGRSEAFATPPVSWPVS